MKKKLVVLTLVVVLVYLPLFSQKSNIAKKDCGCLKSKLTIKTVSPDKNGKKYEKPIPKKNYDKYDYDEAGRITRIVSKDKGETKITYNEYGRLQNKNRSNIESEHYYYDKLGRNTRIEYKSKGKKNSVEFKYSTTEASFKLGNMVEKIEMNEHSFYKYTGRRLIEEKKIIRGHEFVVKYKYNEKGLLSEIHYPSGLIVSYKYNKKNKIENVFSTRNNKKMSVLKYIRGKYYPTFQYGNGLNTVFDANKEKRSILMKIGEVQEMVFFFNEKGIIEKVIDKKNPKNKKEFYYDTQDRLITAYGPWGKINYRYDSMNNLTSKMEKDCKWQLSYDKQSAKIKQLEKNGEKVEINYDKLGRMIKYGEMSFTYNTRGRLEKILKNNEVLVELFYNYKNQRVMEKKGDEEFYYIYDNQDRVLAKYDNKGNVLKEYIYAKETPVGFVENNGIYYYHYDLMNFPVSISDESGKVVRKVQYKPYGEIISVKGNLDETLRYPGQFKIEGTGSYYNLNRTYNPRLGRYIEPDPTIIMGNIYQYAVCNPQKFVDLNGLNVNAWSGKNCYKFGLTFIEKSVSYKLISFGWTIYLSGKNVVGKKWDSGRNSCDCVDTGSKRGRKRKLTAGIFEGIVNSIGIGISSPISVSYLNARGISRRWANDIPKIKEFKGKVHMGSINTPDILNFPNLFNNYGTSIITIGNVGIKPELGSTGSNSFFFPPEISAKMSLIGVAWAHDSGEWKCCGKREY